MSRYATLPKRKADSFWDDGRMVQPLGHPQVFVGEPIKTGLLDQDGNNIYRLPDEIGYLRQSQSTRK